MANGNGAPGWLDKLSEAYSEVHLGPGVMGKTSRATLALILAWCVIFWRFSTDIWQNAFLFVGGCIVSGIFVWWVQRSHAFAEAHPDIALLEGAQLIEWRKWEAQIKGSPPLKSPVLPDPVPTIEDKSQDR